MHVHLPKPLHGWREFVGEVGIIVLGVLIALGAEQVVQAWQWQNDVGIVRDSIMGELSNDRGRWERDLAGSRCALADIRRLDGWANAGAKGPPPPAASLRSGNLLSMHSANWKLAAGSQTLAHFPLREQLAFAALYDGLANRQGDLDRASHLMEQVNSLVPLAGDERERLQLRERLGDLSAALGDLLADESYMKRHFDAVGVNADRSDFAADLRFAGCRGAP